MITDLPSTQSAMLSVWARRAPPGHLLSEWRPMTQTQARMVESHIKQYLEGPPLTLHSTKIQVGTFPVSVYALVYFQDYLGLQILHIIFSHDVRRACLNLVCVFVFLGVISLSRSVYGKANSVIPMLISAQDGGGLVAHVNARVNISVVAGLVAPPVFEQTQYYFTVSEDVLRGTVVGIVQASSKTGRVLTHSLTHSSYWTDPYTFIILMDHA